MARALFALALLAGCDVVFIAEHDFKLPDARPDAGRSCTNDSFETLTNWIITPPPTLPNARIENATLVLPYRGGLNNRSEVVFNRALNFADGLASVRVVAPPPPQPLTYSYFGLAKDADDYHIFRLGSNGGVLVLEFVATTNGVDSSIGELPFDPVLFRYWRFAHLPATNMIEMQTSDTGEVNRWTTRFAAPPIGDVRQFGFVLGALGGLSTNPPAAFDDFSVCTF